MTASSSVNGIMPGRNSTGRRPPARARSIRSPPWHGAAVQDVIHARRRATLRTCSAVVGESSVKRLALGAAIGTPACADQLQRHGMRGHAQPHGGEAGGDDVRECAGPSAPPGSAGRASSAAPVPRPRRATRRPARAPSRWNPRARSAGWCAGRPLASKMRADGRRVERVGAQAVHRLGGEGHQLARADQRRGALRSLTPAARPCRRRRSCRSCARPARRG